MATFSKFTPRRCDAQRRECAFNLTNASGIDQGEENCRIETEICLGRICCRGIALGTIPHAL